MEVCHSGYMVNIILARMYTKQRLKNQLVITLLMKTLEILWYLSQMFHLKVEHLARSTENYVVTTYTVYA